MLLLTRLADSAPNDEISNGDNAGSNSGGDVARWRLLAHVGSSRYTCPEDSPPVEQLILDANTAKRTTPTNQAGGSLEDVTSVGGGPMDVGANEAAAGSGGGSSSSSRDKSLSSVSSGTSVDNEETKISMSE